MRALRRAHSGNESLPSKNIHCDMNRTDHTVASLLKARIVKPVETVVARQRSNIRHVIAATDAHAIREAVFSVRSVPRLYNEDQLLRKDYYRKGSVKNNLWSWVSRGLTPNELIRGKSPVVK
jgi:hypothetical protein